MKRHTQWYGLALLLVAAGFVSPLVPRASAQEAVVVGRIAHTEGQVYHLKNSWLQAHAVAGCQQGGKRA